MIEPRPSGSLLSLSDPKCQVVEMIDGKPLYRPKRETTLTLAQAKHALKSKPKGSYIAMDLDHFNMVVIDCNTKQEFRGQRPASLGLAQPSKQPSKACISKSLALHLTSSKIRPFSTCSKVIARRRRATIFLQGFLTLTPNGNLASPFGLATAPDG